jgi:hypothetical protein
MLLGHVKDPVRLVERMKLYPASKLLRVMSIVSFLLVPVVVTGSAAAIIWIWRPGWVEIVDTSIRARVMDRHRAPFEKAVKLRSDGQVVDALAVLSRAHSESPDVVKGDLGYVDSRKRLEHLRSWYDREGLYEESLEVAEAQLALDQRDLFAHIGLLRSLSKTSGGIEHKALESLALLGAMDPAGELPNHLSAREVYVSRALEQGDTEVAQSLYGPIFASWAELETGRSPEVTWESKAGASSNVPPQHLRVKVSAGGFWTVGVKVSELTDVEELRAVFPNLSSLRLSDFQMFVISDDERREIDLPQDPRKFLERMRPVDGGWAPVRGGAAWVIRDPTSLIGADFSYLEFSFRARSDLVSKMAFLPEPHAPVDRQAQ